MSYSVFFDCKSSFFSHPHQFILPTSYSDLLGVGHTRLPVGVGVEQVPVVVVVLAFFVAVLGGQGVVVAEDGGVVDEVGAGAVQSNWVERGDHADVWHDGGVVVVPAVALGRHVDDDADMEMGLALHYGLGILSNLAVEDVELLIVVGTGGVVLAGGHTLSAAHATLMVDVGLALSVEVDGVVGAVAHADTATDAVLLVDFRFRAAVHLLLAGDAATPHADVF